MVDITKIALGTVQFGLNYGISNQSGQTSQTEVERIVNYANSNGIYTLDTARGYGTSEEVLGQLNEIENQIIISKFLPSSEDISVLNQFETTCEKLQVKSLYGYLAHRPAALRESRKDWENLIRLKEVGKVEKIGYSLNAPSELSELLDLNLIPDLIQVPFSYLDKRFEKDLCELKKKGCEIHTRSSFLQGLLFLQVERLNNHFSEIKPFVKKLQSTYGKNLGPALLRYTLTRPFIDKVVVGVENLDQLKNNIMDVSHAPELPEHTHIFSENILMPYRWPEKKLHE